MTAPKDSEGLKSDPQILEVFSQLEEKYEEYLTIAALADFASHVEVAPPAVESWDNQYRLKGFWEGA